MDRSDPIKEVEEMGLRVSHIMGGEAFLFCPFHAETVPSFCVSTTRPVWFCHGCNKGGSLRDLRDLLDGKPVRPKAPVETRGEAMEVRRIARMSFDQFNGLSSAEGCRYLNDRGITDDTIKSWKIKRSVVFVVFPVIVRDDVKGLILRAMLSEYTPKYQYQPTGIFKKRSMLLTNPNFRVANDMLIVVEGAMDCIRTWQNGYSNVCAVLGSSISERQGLLMSRVAGKILLLFDNDVAGRDAVRKSEDSVMGLNVYVPDYSLYSSSDPGEMDTKELDAIVENPVPLLKAKLKGMV